MCAYVCIHLPQIRTEPRSASYKRRGDRGEEEEEEENGGSAEMMRGGAIGYGGTRVIVKSLATNQVGGTGLNLSIYIYALLYLSRQPISLRLPLSLSRCLSVEVPMRNGEV